MRCFAMGITGVLTLPNARDTITEVDILTLIINYMIKIILTIVAMIVVGGSILLWSNKHTADLMNAMQKYEICIRDQYGVSPAQYYVEQGKYPLCINSNL